METLIELFDERPLENVLSVEILRPKNVVYLCAHQEAVRTQTWDALENFFRARSIPVRLIVRPANIFDTNDVCRALREIYAEFPGCALDITGGSDDALFAAGCFSAETSIPVFTYSRKTRRYYNIRNAEFVEHFSADVQYTAKDFFHMAGAEIETGRMDNAAIEKHADAIYPFFSIYKQYRKQWKHAITWFQRATHLRTRDGEPCGLQVDGAPWSVRAERGSAAYADRTLLREFEKLGFIHELRIRDNESVSFVFDDEETRFWLRDIGSVLELYTWKSCVDSGKFSEVRCSTIINWNNPDRNNMVTNEIDVFATAGIIPVFFSCKTCAVDTDAINELTILKALFGGEMARACIVTTEVCNPITRCRANALGVDVADLNALRSYSLEEMLRWST